MNSPRPMKAPTQATRSVHAAVPKDYKKDFNYGKL